MKNARFDAIAGKSSSVSPLGLIVRSAIIIIAISVAIESFVFNFPFFESLFFQNEETVQFTASTGLRQVGKSTFEVVDEDAYIDVMVDGVHVDNIKLDVSVPGWHPNSKRDALGPFIKVRVAASDKSSGGELIELPDHVYSGGIASSHYIRLHLSGKSSMMRVYFDAAQGEVLSIGGVQINVVQPFQFSLIRFSCIAFLVFLLLHFRPSSPIYKQVFECSRVGHKLALGVIVAAQILVSLFVGRLAGVHGTAETYNPPSEGIVINDFNQYNHLADAILSGSASLNLPVADALTQVDNPYSPEERSNALEASGEQYYMDYAFYNGRYYSYFGVLPALLLFCPYKLATGHDLPTNVGVSILAVFYIIAVNALLVVLQRRYFRKVSVGFFQLASISIVSSSGFIYLVFLPQLYSVPILLGLAVVFSGLSFWIVARNESDGEVHYSSSKLCIGSLLIASSLACRPQYVLWCLLAFPIFWKGIVEERLFFSKRGLKNTLLVIMPFIVVAIPVMLYNYVRFDSPFDFGAAYNLTGGDMTSRGIILARTVPAAFQYLFQPLTMSASFPYITGADLSVDYQGVWFYEPYLGGFFTFAPIGLAVFTVGIWRKRLAASHDTCNLKLLVGILLAVAVVILFVDFQVASITTRYFNDFGWALLLVSWIVVWTEQYAVTRSKYLLFIVAVAVAIGFILNFWVLLSPNRYGALQGTFPSLYYMVQAWF